MTRAHSTALYWSRVNLLLIVYLIPLAERRRCNRILPLIRVHQVLPLHLLFILILDVRLSIGTGDAALTRAALGIRAAVARRRRHTAVYDDRRGRMILYGSEGRGIRGTGNRGRLWLRKIGGIVRHVCAMTGLRRGFRIVIQHAHLRTTDTGLPRYRAVQ